MLALLAKPLDWLVIQLARRYMARSCGPGGSLAPTNTPLSVWDDEEMSRVGAPVADVSVARDGAFQFVSPVATKAAESNCVYGQLHRVAGANWADRPTVILAHGWNAELCYTRQFPYLAHRLNRAGLNAARLELPYHMRRRPRSGPVRDFISGDLGAMVEAARQAVADIRALSGWLRRQGRGTPGLWGFSLGAWLAGMAIRVDDQFGCAVLATPVASIQTAVARLPFCAPVRQGLEGHELDLGPLDLSAAAPRIAPRRILLIESRYDLFAPAETVEQLWRSWGAPDIWRLRHGHISMLMSLPLMERTVQWIRARCVSAPDVQAP